MSNPLVVIGAPSSAGAYAPGQEKAPAVLRGLGLVERLREQGVKVEDYGDITGFRWQSDTQNPRAANVRMVASVAKEVSGLVERGLESGARVLVLGGDCTVELGTVAGALKGSHSVGLLYIDLDTDLNTPESTDDGVLDWMGVAHLLGVDGAVPELVGLGPRNPMLQPDQLLFFGHNNVTTFERRLVDASSIAEVPLAEVVGGPTDAARVALEWSRRFDRLLIHLDVDVLDYAETPLAENTRRGTGLYFETLREALAALLQAPNFAALTVTEINPDHSDEATLLRFIEALTGALS